MQTELIPEGNYVIEDKKEYEKILKSYIKRIIKLTDEQLINFSKKVKTQPLSKEIDWVVSVVLNELQNRNLEKTNTYKTLTEYVRKSPVAHKRKLKSGKVITVKGRAPKPEKIKELIPKKEELKHMSSKEIYKIVELVDNLTDKYPNKKEMLDKLGKIWSKKVEEEHEIIDKWGNSKLDLEMLHDFIKNIEGCIPEYNEKTGKINWYNCSKLYPKDQKLVEIFKNQLVLGIAFRKIARTKFYNMNKGKFYISEAKERLNDDDVAREFYMEELEEGILGFYTSFTGAFFVLGSRYLKNHPYSCPPEITIVHEFGHDFYRNSLSKGERKRIKMLYKQTKENYNETEGIGFSAFFPSYYSSTSQEEFFCECLGHYFYDKKRFENKYPELFIMVEEMIAK